MTELEYTGYIGGNNKRELQYQDYTNRAAVHAIHTLHVNYMNRIAHRYHEGDVECRLDGIGYHIEKNIHKPQQHIVIHELQELGLSFTMREILKKQHIQTIEQLCSLSVLQLLKIPQITYQDINTIQQALHSQGKALKKEFPHDTIPPKTTLNYLLGSKHSKMQQQLAERGIYTWGDLVSQKKTLDINIEHFFALLERRATL